MKILFVSNFHGEYRFQKLMAGVLRKQGAEPVFVTRSDVPEDPRATSWSKLQSAVDRKDIRRNLDSHAQDIESRYEVLLPKIFFSDLLLSGRPPREALVETVTTFRAWESFFRNHTIDYFFWFCDGDVIFRSAHYVGRKKGVRCFTRVPVPIPGAHAWHDNEFDAWDDYEDRPLWAIPADERSRIRTYIQAVRDRRITLALPRRPTANFLDHKVYQFLENLWLKVSRERHNPKWRPLAWARQYVTKVAREREERRFCQTPDLSRPYVFFPLQKPKDVQLTVRAPECRIDEIVETLADVVPRGWRVVVKGHPTWVGTYPIDMYRRFAAKGNIDLVPAHSDVLQLVREARAVVTINNTVGYEAVLLRRPVVTMTPTYYSRFGEVAGNAARLEEALGAALRRGFDAPDEEIERFVANLWAATYPGKTHFILNDKNEVVTRRDLARTRHAWREHAADHGRSVLAKIRRVNQRSASGTPARLAGV